MKSLFQTLATNLRFRDMMITQRALETQRIISKHTSKGRDLLIELRAIRRRDFQRALRA